MQVPGHAAGSGLRLGAFHRGAFWELPKELEAEQQGVLVAACSARPGLPKSSRWKDVMLRLRQLSYPKR